MPLHLIGLNHRTAPVHVRERLAEICCRSLVEGSTDPLECVALFTCNRVEFYFYGPEEQAENVFRDWLVSHAFNPEEFSRHFYRHQEGEAIRHLFRVAAGLDSMVLGESQILAQVKTSYQAGIDAGSVGKRLHALFKKALEVGKRVRTETRISENTVSIASTAVELAGRIFGPLDACHALVIGAGEMATLVATHLREKRIGHLVFTNRTLSRAQELAERFGGTAAPADDLPRLLAEADMIISSTGAPRPILGRESLEAAMQARSWRPMFTIDIAVPRDIAPEAADLENLFLYDIDDLQGVVDENLDQRRVEAGKAETIIQSETSAFQLTVDAFTVVPLIRALRERAEEIRQGEIERFLPKDRPLPAETVELVEQCTRAILAKWLHHPIVGLKELGSAGKAELTAIARLFGLPETVVPNAPLRSLPDGKDRSESCE